MEPAAPIISIQNVTKRFGAVVAVDNIELDIRPNEFFALLGPSGCGKTTLLRMLAGFETPNEGTISIGGKDMTEVAPNRRPVNMVFQSYAVFPHMSVFDNVAYGLRVVKTPSADVDSRVREALAMTQLNDFAERKPDQLSGGQRQRVALARALVKRPQVLLLDEPLSALDAKLREAMQLELVRLQSSVGITFIIVTHDQNEALSMADRIAVMEGGKIRQIAKPSELYEFPNCRFVADFIGKMNLFEGRITGQQDGKLGIDVAGLGQLWLPGGDEDGGGGEGEGEGGASAPPDTGNVGIAVRPEKVRLRREVGPDVGPGAGPGVNRIGLRGKVNQIAYYGDTSHVFVALESGQTISANLQNEARSAAQSITVDEEVWCSWDPRDVLVLTK
jgi:spermidine/putrescine transport system ATP-binding protein